MRLTKHARRYCAGALLLFTMPAPGAGLSLDFMPASRHYVGGEYNERHDGIGVTYGNWSYMRYTNSYNESSNLVTRNFLWASKHVKTLVAGFSVGVVDGYSDHVDLANYRHLNLAGFFQVKYRGLGVYVAPPSVIAFVVSLPLYR